MFQDFATKSLIGRPAERPAADPAGQAAQLIERYPNLSEVELARLINLYRELSALDMALMISDQHLAPKLDRFFIDHRDQLRTPIRQYAALMAIAAIGITVVIWATLSGLM
jgi:hypothetical protein